MPPRRKKLSAVVKVQLPAGAATPAPPVGTALGPHGVNIMDFVKQYNAATEKQAGSIIPVEISIYEDRTFSFVLKTPPAAALLRQAAGLEKGASTAGRETVASVTDAQVAEIAGSIRTFGFSNPILVGEEADVIAGHGRLAAARIVRPRTDQKAAGLLVGESVGVGLEPARV